MPERKPMTTLPQGAARRAHASALAVCMVLAIMAVFAPPALAQSTHLTVASRDIGSTHKLQLGLNKSVVVDLPVDAHEVIVSQPKIAAAIMRTKQRAIVQGVGIGDTNILFMDGSGRRIAALDIAVVNDASALSSAIARVAPNSHIKVQSFGEHVVLSGTAESTDDVNKAVAVATQFVGDPKKVGNVVTVNGAQQVKLKVTVAEVSRESVKQLGIDLNGSYSAGGFSSVLDNIPNSTFGGTTSASGVSPTGTVTAGVDVGSFSLQATLKALERRNALRTLAEPTLTAMSGQSAEFLAGGQLPYYTYDSNNNRVTSWKDYGVKLDFTPTVKSDGSISLQVQTSVSQPDSSGGLQERRAKTTVELRPRATLAIGGLMKDDAKQQMNELPGIGKLPIIGALFRSRDFIHSRSELLILVTPYLAQAGPKPRLPTDDMVFSSDAEAIFLGHMEKLYGVGSHRTLPPDRYNGSVGFMLD